MRMRIERIEAGKVLSADRLSSLGWSASRLVRVTVETIEDDDGPTLTEMNAAGGAFAHLGEDADLYSDDDLVERNEAFVR
jgi:hypothetical protein